MFKETPKFEGFDREFRPRPFQTMFPRSDFFASLAGPKPYIRIALTYCRINFIIVWLKYIAI